ncbi:hypothetical protein [Halobacteriovorax sp. RT-2-6]|uniref:hypothetical protein n=1 Tax=unclassified Halobacteriovorax TaxID=2639665 RepID=UPI00399B4652
MTKIDKEKLTEEMNSKNREWLIESDGVSALFIHNLENFAYRYLETSTDKGIKCVVDGELYQVKSTEPSIIEALKWDNPELKKSLIDLCKKYPGKASKELRVNLSLETKMLGEHKNECSAHITCLLPNGESLILFEKTTSMSFDDPIELRNKHAALLEEVSVIF